jgi:cytochrome c oxidase cbb3-type subunit III
MRAKWLAAAAALVLTTGLALAQAQKDAPVDHAAGAVGQGRSNAAQQTRAFLGLGVEPDKVAAARGKPAYLQNCAGCHGPEGRGGIAPSLLYSGQVLDDDHGEKLTPFLKVGVPAKGMPAFGSLGDRTLTDIAEFLHLQVELYANRGTYENTNNIMTGNPARGSAFFASNCTTCHSATGDLKGVGARFRPLDLQRAMIFPPRDGKPARAMRAVVVSPAGTVEGQVTRIDDFDIVVLDAQGVVRPVRRGPRVKVSLTDPLQWHKDFAYRLKDGDMTDLVTYLGQLK